MATKVVVICFYCNKEIKDIYFTINRHNCCKDCYDDVMEDKTGGKKENGK